MEKRLDMLARDTDREELKFWIRYFVGGTLLGYAFIRLVFWVMFRGAA